MPKDFYYSFIVISTLEGSQATELAFEPVLGKDYLTKNELETYFFERFPDDLKEPGRVLVAEGREDIVLRPPRACRDGVSFVERVAGRMKADDALRARMVQAARYEEASEPYIFEKPAPIRHGRFSKEAAYAALKADCGKAGEFAAWGTSFSLQQMSYLEARQVLVALTLDGPTLLRIKQFAKDPDGSKVEIGSFLLPIFDR